MFIKCEICDRCVDTKDCKLREVAPELTGCDGYGTYSRSLKEKAVRKEEAIARAHAAKAKENLEKIAGIKKGDIVRLKSNPRSIMGCRGIPQYLADGNLTVLGVDSKVICDWDGGKPFRIPAHALKVVNPKADYSKPYIIALIGPSGSGKTTVATILKERFGLNCVESYTTRPKRSEDEGGHIFITEDEFKARYPKGADDPEIVAYTYYNGNHYFATHSQVNECEVYIIDPAGVHTLKKRYVGNKVIIPIWLYADSDVCMKRMLLRGDKAESAIQRKESKLRLCGQC